MYLFNENLSRMKTTCITTNTGDFFFFSKLKPPRKGKGVGGVLCEGVHGGSWDIVKDSCRCEV